MPSIYFWNLSKHTRPIFCLNFRNCFLAFPWWKVPVSVFGIANCVQIFLQMSTNICPQLNRGHHHCKQAAEHSSSITRLSTHSLCFEPLVVLAQQQCWHWQTYNVCKVQMIWDRNLFKILPKAQHTSDLIVSAISTNEKSAHFHFTGEQITKAANKITKWWHLA